MKASSLYSNNRMLKSFQVRVSPVPWVKQHVTCRWICSWVPVSKLQQDKTSALCYRLLYFRCSLPQANYGARRSPTQTNPSLQRITHKKPNITPSFTTSAFSSQLVWKKKSIFHQLQEAENITSTNWKSKLGVLQPISEQRVLYNVSTVLYTKHVTLYLYIYQCSH